MRATGRAAVLALVLDACSARGGFGNGPTSPADGGGDTTGKADTEAPDTTALPDGPAPDTAPPPPDTAPPPPDTAPPPDGPEVRCGDGRCEAGETCDTCAMDCPCAPRCGDGRCNGTESCDTCAMDCPCTNPCASPTLCSACTSTPGCGFCRATNRCLQGSSSGSMDGNCTGTNWVRFLGSCEVTDPCGAVTSCASCTSSTSCGWCRSTNACVRGTASGSTDGTCTGTNWVHTSGATRLCPTTPTGGYRAELTTVPFSDACAAPGRSMVLPSLDDSATLVPLPFEFTYYGRSFPSGSMVNVVTNGWIGLGATTTDPSYGFPIPSTSPPNGVIAVVEADLDTRTQGICVATTGSAPSRRFVVEWAGAGDHGSTVTASNFTFEVVLHEGTNVLEYSYLSMVGGTRTYYVGLENHDGSAGTGGCPGGAFSCRPTTGSGVRFTPTP